MKKLVKKGTLLKKSLKKGTWGVSILRIWKQIFFKFFLHFVFYCITFEVGNAKKNTRDIKAKNVLYFFAIFTWIFKLIIKHPFSDFFAFFILNIVRFRSNLPILIIAITSPTHVDIFLISLTRNRRFGSSCSQNQIKPIGFGALWIWLTLIGYFPHAIFQAVTS